MVKSFICEITLGRPSSILIWKKQINPSPAERVQKAGVIETFPVDTLTFYVIPVKTGIQDEEDMDSCLRRNDNL